MSSGKRKWNEADAEKAARLEGENEQLHQLERMLDLCNKRKQQLQELLDARVTLTVNIAKADSVEREVVLKALQKCEDLTAELKGQIAEALSEAEIRSQIRAKKDLIQELSTKTYTDMVVSAGPPSTVEKDGLYKHQTKVPGQPLYECCYPASAQPPLPLLLAHPIFGKFLDDFNNVDAPLKDDLCTFVVDLCYDVLGRMQPFDTEAEFQIAFNLKMEVFLGHSVFTDMVVCRTAGTSVKATTDLTVRQDGKWTVVGELKLEKGTTLAQGLQTVALYAGSLDAKTKLLPCFLMEVIGPTIRIGACVFFEKVAWQPLTPFMNCFYTVHDRTDMATLCRAMRALRNALIALGSYFKEAHPSDNTMTPKDIPYPLQGRQSDRIGNKLVFIVTIGDGERRIFKYCRQYGEEVHRSWAEAGLAPLLYGCKPIPGGWLEVEMQYLEDWIPSSCLERVYGAASNEIRSAISRELERALAIPINGCPVAHGDMRPPNIMIKRLDGGGYDIKFTDFDWAGKVGVARYPPFINKGLDWHPDVGAGELLAQNHDKWWMSGITGAISPSNYYRQSSA